MKKTALLTLKEARDYLQRTRNLTVSRQTLHTLVQRNEKKCEKIGGSERPTLWRIPTSLLDTFQPSALHQQNGKSPKIKGK